MLNIYQDTASIGRYAELAEFWRNVEQHIWNEIRFLIT